METFQLVLTAEHGLFGRRVDFRDFRRFCPLGPIWGGAGGWTPTIQFGELARAKRLACVWVTAAAPSYPPGHWVL